MKLFSLLLLAAVNVVLAAPRCYALNAGEVELTREGKYAIKMALQNLAAKQRADGSFNGHYGSSPAGVAAACLAFMSQGNLPGEGPYGKNVAKAVDYLLTSAHPTGRLYLDKQNGSSYVHGMSAICLAEVWGHTRDKRIYDKLKKAIDLTIRSQNEHGGWHYVMKNTGTADLSTTVMQLMALRAAKDAGIAVPKETIDKAVGYVESCRTRETDGLSGFAYAPGGGRKWSTTALGVMSLMLCGQRKPGAVKEGLEYLIKAHKNQEDTSPFVYGHYYGAMAMYQAGGHRGKYLDYWKYWYPEISNMIIKSQVNSGPAAGTFKKDEAFGVWSQGMCVLILAIPYRYLPVYQR
jgi:hypothetical protein